MCRGGSIAERLLRMRYFRLHIGRELARVRPKYNYERSPVFLILEQGCGGPRRDHTERLSDSSLPWCRRSKIILISQFFTQHNRNQCKGAGNPSVNIRL